MALTFPPINNRATVPITTVKSNILFTVTSSSTITRTAITSMSGMLSINSGPAISLAATEQDLNFETALNVVENIIFELSGTLEKFISVNNTLGKLQGKNDRGYLNGFSINTSQSAIEQSSDDEINCGPPPQNKPSRNAVNICRTSKNVFDKEINLLVPDAEKHDQSGKHTVQKAN